MGGPVHAGPPASGVESRRAGKTSSMNRMWPFAAALALGCIASRRRLLDSPTADHTGGFGKGRPARERRERNAPPLEPLAVVGAAREHESRGVDAGRVLRRSGFPRVDDRGAQERPRNDPLRRQAELRDVRARDTQLPRHGRRRRRLAPASSPFLELAQVALEQAAVPLLVGQDRDHHVLRHLIDALGDLMIRCSGRSRRSRPRSRRGSRARCRSAVPAAGGTSARP